MFTEEKLRELGIYERDGRTWHDRPRNRNFRFDPTDPKAVALGKLVSYEQEQVPWPVIVPTSNDPVGVEEARKRAVKQNADFYHPTHGWLRWGKKRCSEAPENMGTGAKVYPKRVITVEPAPDAEAPAASADPVAPGPVRRRQEG